jgi:tRNA (guanine37-N1)-methyltransferase
MIPGVLGHEESAPSDSFFAGLLDYPHYTRPRVWRGMEVPQVLLSGDHEKIRLYRRKEALKRTASRRPDMISALDLGEEDLRLLNDLPKSKKRASKKLVPAEKGN